jgi:hypothetical protein
MKRFGRGSVTVPDIESVQVHVMGAAIMVQGSSENEFDFPWHLRASSTNIQRWLCLGAALVQVSHSVASSATFPLVFGVQQLLVVLQQEGFFAEVSATEVVLFGPFRIA